MSGRVVIIGVDGATSQFMFNNDKISNHDAMRHFSDVRGEYKSTFPHVTIPAWVSMYTADTPEQLDLFGFYDREIVEVDGEEKGGNGMGLNSANRIRDVPKIWDIISGKTTVLNVPLTYPVDEHYGIMVSGMIAPEKNDYFAKPSSLRDKLVDIDYEIDVPHFMGSDQPDVDSIRDVYGQHRDVALKLLKRDDWEFFMYVDMEVDRVQHACWNDSPEDIVDSYISVLDFIEDVHETVDEDDVVVVVSDHGFETTDYMVYINKILEDMDMADVSDGSPTDDSLMWSVGGMCSRVYCNVEGRDVIGNLNVGSLAESIGVAGNRIENTIERVIDVSPEFETGDVLTIDALNRKPDMMVRGEGLRFSADADVDKYMEEVEMSSHKVDGIYMVSDNYNGTIGGFDNIWEIPNLVAEYYPDDMLNNGFKVVR